MFCFLYTTQKLYPKDRFKNLFMKGRVKSIYEKTNILTHACAYTHYIFNLIFIFHIIQVFTSFHWKGS